MSSDHPAAAAQPGESSTLANTNPEVKQEELDASISTEIASTDPNQPDAMNLDGTTDMDGHNNNSSNNASAPGASGSAGLAPGQDPNVIAGAPPASELRIPTKKDASLREFLSKMDDYAPIVSASSPYSSPSPPQEPTSPFIKLGGEIPRSAMMLRLLLRNSICNGFRNTVMTPPLLTRRSLPFRLRRRSPTQSRTTISHWRVSPRHRRRRRTWRACLRWRRRSSSPTLPPTRTSTRASAPPTPPQTIRWAVSAAPRASA